MRCCRAGRVLDGVWGSWCCQLGGGGARVLFMLWRVMLAPFQAVA